MRENTFLVNKVIWISEWRDNDLGKVTPQAESHTESRSHRFGIELYVLGNLIASMSFRFTISMIGSLVTTRKNFIHLQEDHRHCSLVRSEVLIRIQFRVTDEGASGLLVRGRTLSVSINAGESIR